MDQEPLPSTQADGSPVPAETVQNPTLTTNSVGSEEVTWTTGPNAVDYYYTVTCYQQDTTIPTDDCQAVEADGLVPLVVETGTLPRLYSRITVDVTVDASVSPTVSAAIDCFIYVDGGPADKVRKCVPVPSETAQEPEAVYVDGEYPCDFCQAGYCVVENGKFNGVCRERYPCDQCGGGYCTFNNGVWTGSCAFYMQTALELNAEDSDFVDLYGACTCVDECGKKKETPRFCFASGTGSCQVSRGCIKDTRPYLNSFGVFESYLCC